MINSLLFQVHGNADHHNNLAESIETLLIFITSLLEKSPLEVFRTLLPGMGGLHNVHPLFVHFPIAFLLGFFILDVFGGFTYKMHCRKAASFFLYFGTVSAMITVAAGLVAAATVEHGGNVHEMMERHEHFGITVLGLSCLLSVWRMNVKTIVSDISDSLFMLLSTVLCVYVVLTADLGGMMVYQYGVAVNGVPQESHEHKHGGDSVVQDTSEQKSDKSTDSAHEHDHGHHDAK